MSNITEKSKRNYTKRLIGINICLAWLVLIFGVFTGQADALVTHVFSFITVLIGIYTGVGHMDYRQVLNVTAQTSKDMLGANGQTSAYEAEVSSYSDEATGASDDKG